MSSKNPILKALKEGDLNSLQILLENCPKEKMRMLISCQYSGTTPLAIACKNGHLKVVKYLVDHCKADIEQVCNVQFDEDIIEDAPPLWCAAAAGHFDIVKYLISKNAKVNAVTWTQSTSLRAACYDGNLEVVKYLIEHGADIEIANRHDHTCLMIACFKSHYKVAKYLLKKGAQVNRKSLKGSTALHDCAESGNVPIMQLLLGYGAKMEKDCYGVSPLISAVIHGHTSVVELIISNSLCDNKDVVDALELLGSTYVDKKRNMQLAFRCWQRALKIRAENGMEKQISLDPVEAYNNVIEFTTLEQLENIFSDHDLIKMQALLIRERILGPAHSNTLHCIRFRGATYADAGNFDRCIKLWFYALDLQQKILKPLNPMTQTSLISFSELFSFMMMKGSVKVKFSDLIAVFQRALCELQSALLTYKASILKSNTDSDMFQRTLVIQVNIIGLLCKLKPQLSLSEIQEMKKAIYHLVILNPRGTVGSTLLHIVAGNLYDPFCQFLRPTSCSLMKFPTFEVINLLLEVGASPNDTDHDKNTPLHISATTDSCNKSVFELLLKKGSHIDFCNNKGETPLDLLKKNSPSVYSKINSLKFTSLQCLSARVIKKKNIRYTGLICSTLELFVNNH